MSINVNTLINGALRKCSLIGDGQYAEGDYAINALEDLKSVIAKLNQQNLILQDVKTVDVNVSDIITFAVKPNNWFEYADYATMLATLNEHEVGDICHIITPNDGKNFYSVCSFTLGQKEFHTTDEWNASMKALWPTKFVDILPDRVLGLGRWIANRFVQLYPADKMRIDSYPKVGLATEYTVETENIRVNPIQAEERGNTVTYFKIETNARTPAKLRVTYLEQIPNIKIEDTLYFSNIYETMLEEGLCAELCLRYKLMDLKETFENEFDNSVRLLKRTNQANRPMTYDFSNNGSYMDNYYNGFSPVQWS